MKELPILFSTPMVLALLAGTKTQTRRVQGLGQQNWIAPDWKFSHLKTDDKKRIRAYFQPADPNNGEDFYNAIFPYGHVGDRLYVRETWAYLPNFIKHGKTKLHVDYKADQIFPGGPYKWKPSIHMRKEHARIWLEITEVKVERMLSISEGDAIAEGVERWPSEFPESLGYDMRYQSYLNPVPAGSQSGHAYYNATCSFIELWESINGTESANSNPWVWAITFKVLSTIGKPAPADQEAAAV